MTREELTDEIERYLNQDGHNRISGEDAMRDDLAGMRVFEKPLVGIADAGDPFFEKFRDPTVVRDDYLTPEEWLPGARSVISVFLPFTEIIRTTNRTDPGIPSDEWQHGRIEGQEIVENTALYLCGFLEDRGAEALFPVRDERFNVKERKANWSERHTAYACGIGTFGMSRGIITEKGMAGRLLSVITAVELPATERSYSDPYEYCIKCGKCAGNCPVQAIDKKKVLNLAKDNRTCREYLARMHELPVRGKSRKQRYGCGKCQVNVPCESRRPDLHK